MTWLDDLKLETVIVSTRDGDAIRGLRSSVYDDGIVLREARLVQEEGISSPIDGEYFVPREMVAGIQILRVGS
jgi:hypothetical protein